MKSEKRQYRFSSFCMHRLGGSIRIGPLVLYGWNAMHIAANLWLGRRGWFCLHPPFQWFSTSWPWYCYISPDATPSAATWGVGPGFER